MRNNEWPSFINDNEFFKMASTGIKTTNFAPSIRIDRHSYWFMNRYFFVYANRTWKKFHNIDITINSDFTHLSNQLFTNDIVKNLCCYVTLSDKLWKIFKFTILFEVRFKYYWKFVKCTRLSNFHQVSIKRWGMLKHIRDFELLLWVVEKILNLMVWSKFSPYPLVCEICHVENRH